MTFPFGIKQTLAYIGFLLAPKDKGGRGLQGKSVEKYLSALRMVHMQRGFFSPWIRPEIVSLITKGAENRDQTRPSYRWISSTWRIFGKYRVE